MHRFWLRFGLLAGWTALILGAGAGPNARAQEPAPAARQDPAAVIPAASSEQATNWTQWRGPERNSLVDSKLLSGLADLKSVTGQWTVPLGPGYCGPIVTSDKVFVAETKDEKYEIVRAFDRQSGKQIWEHQWEGSLNVPFFAKANGDWIRATPVWHDGRLFVGGIRDVLVCLNDADGSELWRIDFVEQFGSPPPDFGMVCSPLVNGDHLYIQAGNAACKIEYRTGKVVWKTLEVPGNMMSGGAFSSPVIGKLCGVDQLLVQTREKMAGVSLEDGKVLWEKEVPTFRGMNILTPLVLSESLVFTSTYQGGSFLFEIAKSESGWSCTQKWQARSQGYMSSPVLVNGYIYLHLRNQRFVCMDPATGNELWKTDKYGQYWSMIASGDRILALDEKGDLLLIRANPEKFELLDQRKVADSTAWAHVGLAGNQLFIRELDSLQVWKLPEPAGPQ
jgi:outer membrane protein assembly factor BamB